LLWSAVVSQTDTAVAAAVAAWAAPSPMTVVGTSAAVASDAEMNLMRDTMLLSQRS
jgi:hypothetical protein